MQAQAPFPPYYGLWSRLAGFRPDDLAELLLNRRVVRIALMRGTIHLVSARDCLTLRPLIQPVMDRAMANVFGKRLADMDTRALASAGRALVEEKPRTFSELGALLSPHWPGHTPASLAQGRQRLFTRNGVFPGTVLVDGFAAGMWRITRSRGAAALTVEPFGPISARDREAVMREAERLLGFAAAGAGKHEIRFAAIA